MNKPLQQAREFLNRVVDWDGVSYVNLHYFVQKPGYDRRFMQGTAVQSVDAAIEQLIWLAGQSHPQDVYFCTATQASCEEKQFGRRLVKTAIRNRDQALHLKALFLDIDVGKKDGYATPTDAIDALKKFILDTKLPAPTAIVASGTGGFHVYWIAQQPWEVTAWQPLADAMVAATKASGLICDTQCTVDAVRILRIPQTRNFKTNPPSPVVLKSLRPDDVPNEVLEQALAPFMDRTVAQPLPQRQSAEAWEGDEFAAGIEAGAAPRDIDEVAVHCPWIRDTLANGGAGNDNPKWFLSLRLGLFCREPDQTGHRLSSGHHGYHPAETDQELGRLRRERERNPRIGFPSCKTIHASGVAQCASCPLLQDGKSPLNAAKPVPVASVPAVSVSPFMPAGYRIDPLGRIVQDETDDKGRVKSIIIFPFPIRDLCVVKTGVTSEGDPAFALQFFSHRNGGRVDRIMLPLEVFASKDTLGRAFSSRWLNMRVTDKVLDFFMSFLQKLRESKDSVSEVQPYGWCWSDDEASRYMGFAFAGKLYGKDGDGVAPLAEPSIAQIYRPVGSPAHWLEAVRLINRQKRPALDTFIAASFAAPLVTLLDDLKGICIGGVSRESGIGKTTAMNIATAVWGNPAKAKQGMDDTDNSVFNKAVKISSLPLFWDELKTSDETDKFLKIVFRLSDGREKSRATQAGNVRDQKTFKTILTYASNESMYEPMLRRTTGTEAGHLRMFEFVVPPIPDGQQSALIGAVTGKLEQNYGHAGAEYAAYIGGHHMEIADLVQDVQKKWAAIVKAKPEERFWVGACAALIVATKLSNQLGLTEIDEPGLRKFLYNEFTAKQVKRAESPNDLSRPEAVAAILGDFLAEKAMDFTLITNQVLLTRGRPTPGAIKVEGEGTARLNRLRAVEVQYGRENGILRISDMALGQWLKAKGYPKGSFTGALKDRFGAVSTYGRLGSGTAYSDTVTRQLWQVTIPGSGLEDLVEFETENCHAQTVAPEPVPA